MPGLGKPTIEELLKWKRRCEKEAHDAAMQAMTPQAREAFEREEQSAELELKRQRHKIESEIAASLQGLNFLSQQTRERHHQFQTQVSQPMTANAQARADLLAVGLEPEEEP